MASYSSMKQEVNVLLVEHDTNHLISVRQMLEFFSYKVKCVEYASTALSMLSNGKARFDIVMANINSPEDSCTFKLLQEAYKMDLLVILMCDNNDDMTARSALEVGAFLFLEKPITMENVMYLWQHVWRKKTWKIKEKEQFREIVAYNTTRNGFVAEEEIPMENVKSDDKEVENGDESSKKARTRKVWAEWTQELHNKFVDAAIQLGEGKCYPEEILELMNVPGLTRVQVASHLQKCRNGNWRPREEQKSHTVNIVASPKIEATKPRPRKYGSMPFLTKHSEQQNLQIQEDAEKIQDPQIYDPTNNNNTVFDNYPQLPQVEPLQDSSGCTFARDNVETPYTEPDGTNLQIEPDAFMPDDLFVFDFNSVTSGSLHADIDQLNYPGQISVNPNMPTTD